MIPLNPAPKAADTANSPRLVLGQDDPASAGAWQIDAARIVYRPPARSDSQPQNSRLTKALPSSVESIRAPRAGPMPRSLQRATRWAAGIAIGTQQKKPAMHRSANTNMGDIARAGAR